MTRRRSKSSARAALAWMIAAGIAGCGKGSNVADADSAPSSSRALVKRPPIKTQDIAGVCALVPVPDVENVLGKLTAPPQSGEDACLYLPAPVRNQAVRVVLRIDPTGAQPLEQAEGALGDMFARELSDGAQRTAQRKKRED